jgi:hypothetical protein
MQKGTVIVYSWGYEQTNVEFYTVLKKTKKTVLLQKMITKEIENEGTMSGIAIPDGYKDEVIRKKLSENDFIEFEFGIGKVWNNQPVYYSYYS